MVFRVVDKSSLTFETDIPLALRNTHPSGVLHAFRTTTGKKAKAKSRQQPGNKREEYTFAWISNAVHIETALNHLEKRLGFDRSDGIVFIPYSTKQNWTNRYPHAALALEYANNGKVVSYLSSKRQENNSSDGPGGAEEQVWERDENLEPSNDSDDETPAESSNDQSNSKKRKRKKRKTVKRYLLKDYSSLPDAERDELHIEIYNYLSWLNVKLIDLEKQALEAAPAPEPSAAMNPNESCPQLAHKTEIEVKKRFREGKGIDLEDLQVVVDKIESAFFVIFNANLEEEAAGVPAAEGVPFLEKTCSAALERLTLARERAGKVRRKKKRRKKKVDDRIKFSCVDFDELFERLVRYKEEHGDCLVRSNYQDKQLANFVRRTRERKNALRRKGISVEEVLPGQPIYAKTLNAERVQKLESIGFSWCQVISWEDRFRDLMEYYEANDGKWPSQSMGGLGEWVHKQRIAYAKGDVNYMKKRAPTLDEVGFEWTPRGNTRMSWDDGFEMLMEFGRINDHFDVPRPSGEANSDNGEEYFKSEAYRLYRWVMSLHTMYRSFTLGRKSGSLTEERVILLLENGFVFRSS